DGKVMGVFSHTISKGMLPDSSKIWFNKQMGSESDARLEVLAQEFFRLLVPGQPETRLAWDPVLKTYHVLSEDVPGFRNLPEDQQQEFTKGTYYGLGQVSLIAAFLHEIDFKNGNVGINNHNQVVKLDGDWCFACLREPSEYGAKLSKITPELLASLPYPKGIYAYNWLDIRMTNINYPTSRLVDASLANAPHFRNEVNQAILKILLLPDSYLKNFVDAYMPNSTTADQFIDYLQKRRDELKIAAKQDKSFQTYLTSQAAQEDVRNHLIHMKGFVANGSQPIIKPSPFSTLDMDYKSLIDELIPPVMPKPHPVVHQKPSIIYRGRFSAGAYYEDANTGIFYIEKDNHYHFTNQQAQIITPPSTYSAMMVKAVQDYKVAINQQNLELKTVADIQNIKVSFGGVVVIREVEQLLAYHLNLIEQSSKTIENLYLKPEIIKIIQLKKEGLNQAAQQQIRAISDAERILVHTVERINNFHVDFTNKHNEIEINISRQKLWAEVQALTKSSQLHQALTVLNLRELPHSIRHALEKKQKYINQQADAQIGKMKEVTTSWDLIGHAVQKINNFPVDFTVYNNEAKINEHRQHSLTEVQKLVQNTDMEHAHLVLNFQSLHPSLVGALTKKQAQINQQAQSQIDKMQKIQEEERRMAQAVNCIAQTVRRINNFSIDFTHYDSEQEVDGYAEQLQIEINKLVHNDVVKQAHHVLNLEHLHQDIRQALANKQQKIEQAVALLSQRLNLLNEMRFDDHLQIFADKIIHMEGKVQNNALYVDAKREMETFYSSVKNAKKNFLHSPDSTERAKRQLKEDCHDAIDAARPILKDHREWRGAIIKFIIDVLSFLTCGLTDNKLGMFALTDSNRRLVQFEQATENMLVG
ncbi:hypothetical protein LOX96_15210, partial [Legionella sp. HCPI-6]|nr:hypothetical protein [Legionella maioricensis]